MSARKATTWAKVLFAGLGVAVFTFVANTVWERLSHRSVGPDYVHAALRVEDGVLLLYLRNESDEPLDLVLAEIEINQAKGGGGMLGVYPVPSHIYEVESGSDAELEQQEGRLVVKLRISQAIEPGDADQFGFKILGPSGPLTPAAGSVKGTITDLQGNKYYVEY